jgi:hypothetical protein
VVPEQASWDRAPGRRLPTPLLPPGMVQTLPEQAPEEGRSPRFHRAADTLPRLVQEPVSGLQGREGFHSGRLIPHLGTPGTGAAPEVPQNLTNGKARRSAVRCPLYPCLQQPLWMSQGEHWSLMRHPLMMWH